MPLDKLCIVLFLFGVVCGGFVGWGLVVGFVLFLL